MDQAPAVSVVIPCRNERRHIEACVRSMLAQVPPPGGFEVIVADGMSDDGTREILQRLAGEDPRLRVVDNPERVTPCAMNAGIGVARGRFVAIAGAHNRYAPDYLQQSVAVLEETGADNVGGAMICEGDTRVQRAVAAAHHSRFGAGGARWHNPTYEGVADTVFGGVYRRDVFTRIGLFDRELVRNQDDEFNLRLLRSGGKIWQSPRIRSWYRPRATLRALFHQYFQYGYWKVRVIQKHRLPASVRHLMPGAFVLSFVLLPAVGLLWRPALILWAIQVSAYAFASIVAGIRASRRSGGGVWWLMPAVFACYHFGYGLGFLAGLRDLIVSRESAPEFSHTLTRSS
jgi:glycosyltransferase involved in cell wall biosynthesis